MVEDTRRLLRLLLLAAISALTFCQSDDDSSLYFSNAQSGRAVWLVEEANLPWIGSYEYLSSLVSENTVLLTVVDSSTGRTLGECTTQSHGNKWVKFQWALAADSMQCTVSPTNSSRVVFPAAPGPRTFSVRIQAGRGPACIKQMIVQNERPIGCPPHLARNSFSAMHFACNCPYEATSSEEPSESADPQFPIFELGTPSPTMETPAWTVSPCATHKCQHNGTCVVTQEGQATCLCQQGFTGSQCEVDVCAAVPCQNGGTCRATAGNEAVCECPEGFTGLICETAKGSCNPECTNGECVVTNGTSHCKCRQGFIGINCNVVDVCLGDAACAVFGDDAKCVLDPSNYIMHSLNLVNATYDCRCPHPVNGEFEDCLTLHLAAQASAGTMGTSPPATSEILPNSGVQTGMFPHPTVEMQPNGQNSQFSMFPNTMTGQPGMLPNGETSAQPSSTHPTLGVHFPQTGFPFNPTTMETESHSVSFTNQPSVQTHGSLPPVTFVFPQTPQTTQHPSTIEHQPTHPVTREPEEETAATTSFAFVPDHSFPTPAPMDINRPTVGHAVHPAEFNPFHALMTTTPAVETTAESEETTRESEPTTESTEEATHEDYEEQSQEMTTGGQSTEITHPSTTQTTEAETIPTTQSSLPFWMFSTQRVVPQVPQETFGSLPTPGRPISEETPTERHEEVTTADGESSQELQTTPVVETTTAESDVHQQETGSVDHQSSSATSWIVSILAMIVVGLLLLAAVLFILRYMKQSRKLHGKYNPAREEHALSAAYSMPMSHITKEERLI